MPEYLLFPQVCRFQVLSLFQKICCYFFVWLFVFETETLSVAKLEFALLLTLIIQLCSRTFPAQKRWLLRDPRSLPLCLSPHFLLANLPRARLS